jgi:hypothetical protein
MKIKFILAIICLGLINVIGAQVKVPAAAENAFKKMFPSATKVKWDKESKSEYEASFELNGKKGSANFTPTGEWIETEKSIDQSAAPKVVIDAVTKAWPKATVKEVFEIETKDGKHYYEIEYSINGKTKEAKIAADGKLIK